VDRYFAEENYEGYPHCPLWYRSQSKARALPAFQFPVDTVFSRVLKMFKVGREMQQEISWAFPIGGINYAAAFSFLQRARNSAASG
jgi:hypothetical protein